MVIKNEYDSNISLKSIISDVKKTSEKYPTLFLSSIVIRSIINDKLFIEFLFLNPNKWNGKFPIYNLN